MRTQRLTSKEVAKRAGVSQSTVSFVLNNVESANISEETKQRVLEVAHKLGYVPNVAARALARGHSSTIALILDHPHPQIFLDEYIPKVMTGLSQIMRENGYRILVEIVDDMHQKDVYTNLIRGREVSGLIINFNDTIEHTLDDLVAFAEKGFPVIQLDEYDPRLHCVRVDKYGGVRQAVQHLISLGHRRIACITYGPVVEGAHVHQRLQTYRDTLMEARIAYDESLIRVGNYDPETGYAAMSSLLDTGTPLTALFAMNDVMAFGAMAAIHQRGLRVPEDIAVVGFDDIRLASFARPALTTVFEPDVEHGRLAGESLLRLINPKEVPHIQHLPMKLVIRESCGFRQNVATM